MHKRSVHSNVSEKKNAWQNVNSILDQSECDRSQQEKKENRTEIRQQRGKRGRLSSSRFLVNTLHSVHDILYSALMWVQTDRFRCDLKRKIEKRLVQRNNIKVWIRCDAFYSSRIFSSRFVLLSIETSVQKRDTFRKKYRNMFIDVLIHLFVRENCKSDKLIRLTVAILRETEYANIIIVEVICLMIITLEIVSNDHWEVGNRSECH